MDNLLKVIMSRRSIRRFTAKPVSKDVVDKILKAAMSAPSATNEQPWHFIVIDQRVILDKIAAVHQYAAACRQAQLAIMLCVDLAQGEYRGFWTQDMSAATQNILLAVRVLGLGAVWLGIYPNNERVKALNELFGLPASVIPFALIPIGHTDIIQREDPERFRVERIHYNKW